jgi:hypothetical protein
MSTWCLPRWLAQVFPSNYIKTPLGWEDVLQPVSSCSEPPKSIVESAPKLKAKNLNAHAEAKFVFVDIIDNAATSYDPPAMPWDVLEAAQLFNSRPQTWWVYTCILYRLWRGKRAAYKKHYCGSCSCWQQHMCQ